MTGKAPGDWSPWAEMEATQSPGLPYPSSTFTEPLGTHQGSPQCAYLKWYPWEWFWGCITTYLVFILDPTFLCWRVPPLLPGCTACFEVFRGAKSGFNKINRFGPLDLLLSRGRMWVCLLSRDINTHNFLLFYKDSCSTMCPPLVTVSYFMYPLQQVSLKNLSTFTSFA